MNGSASVCCQRVLDDSERLHGDSSHSAHERYIAIYRIFDERDKEVARLFNDLRRSTALLQIAALKGRGLLTEEEFARFSQETQGWVAALLGESTPSSRRPGFQPGRRPSAHATAYQIVAAAPRLHS
ncbi:MAG TPA: hypothetical protein VKG02_03365, partial [Blastocatellia bacterium]|nr:hypothetical protein [Blastocatellia bacterium]